MNSLEKNSRREARLSQDAPLQMKCFYKKKHILLKKWSRVKCDTCWSWWWENCRIRCRADLRFCGETCRRMRWPTGRRSAPGTSLWHGCCSASAKVCAVHMQNIQMNSWPRIMKWQKGICREKEKSLHWLNRSGSKVVLTCWMSSGSLSASLAILEITWEKLLSRFGTS